MSVTESAFVETIKDSSMGVWVVVVPCGSGGDV